MSKQKVKGRRFEHEVADAFTAGGIPAKRIFMSGQLAGIHEDLDGDVVIDHTGEKIECKYRENISMQLWDWLEGNDYLALRRNNKKALIVIPLDKFVELRKGACWVPNKPLSERLFVDQYGQEEFDRVSKQLADLTHAS